MIDQFIPTKSYLSVDLREEDHIGDKNNDASAEHRDDDGKDDVKLSVFLLIIILKT